MLTVYNFLLFSCCLFFISLIGMIINKNNIIILLMSLELSLLSVNTNFLIFSYFMEVAEGSLAVFFILAVAAVEVSIGLAIIVKLYRKTNKISIDQLNILKH